MKRLYVFRGLPGSGKSTLAAKMAALVVEPDMFRYDADKHYVFDSDKNAEVIRKTGELLEYAMDKLEMASLAVTATHVKIDHFKKYVDAGKKRGYDVVVVECYDRFGNVHNVPESVMARMAKEFEPMSAATAAEWGVLVLRHRQGAAKTEELK